MSEYLVEVYLSRDAQDVPPTTGALSTIAHELTNEGRPVELLGSVFVPDEETCFYLFEAQSGEFVKEAARRCGLRYDRLAEAIWPWTGVRGQNPSKERS